jgi:hypothetical protein
MSRLLAAALVALALAGCQAQPPEPTRPPEQTPADLTELLMPTQPRPPAPCTHLENEMGWNGCPAVLR